MLLDPMRALRVIEQLHAVGVLTSIDDYGTGFSSLGYLRDLSTHALKLDKSFVRNLEAQQRNRVIVESTVHMAHSLGLEIVAEGVESDWTADYLTRIGYDYAQGYRFAKPMPAQQCFDWVMRFNAEHRRRAV
jgi:EAL domain-containing protein (putative c-di-GMP-specific phosphodiesterase class I)